MSRHISGVRCEESPLPPRHDRGAGTVLALAVVAVTVTLTTATIGVVGAWGARQKAAVAADATALAAADVAAGRTSGEPCAEADIVARANGASVTGCVVAAVVVSVEVSVPYLGWEASAAARAGPPGSR
ncbi:Rv3654c family TadE-like protein [Microbacterium sp. X-17]|uniref:Rv3654c family TadE-like protein n=1 Tax=Microbacterium sp. X-17 TaxID=3144404 RepID=UPI0031F4BAA3